jgi:hypothetical protein
MKNTGKLSRIFFAFILSLSLGVAPTLTVYAQQEGQKQSAPQAKSSGEKTQHVTEEKNQSSEGELLPLSDAEMEKVQGGWLPVALGVVSLGVSLYALHKGSQAHHKILKSCR